MSNQFTHLHVHSYYSILDGLSSPESLVECASNMGYKSLALTDHGSCAGLVKFQDACIEKDIKPILGFEAYTCNDHKYKEKDDLRKYYHLILLAKNEVGYLNLVQLSSKAYLDGFYAKPRIDFGLLEKHREGLIVSSACCAGEIPMLLWNNEEEKALQLIGKYKEVFKDDFYLEIMIHKYNDAAKEQEERERKLANMIRKVAIKVGVKAIATQDAHYARKEEWEAHDTLLAIQTIDTIKNPDRFSFNSKDFYLKPYDEMAELYSRVPELLTNTMEIAEKVQPNLISIGADLLPAFTVPEGFKDEEAYLKELITTGMKEKGLINKQVYRDRIKYEMSVIITCKYTRYFLILWDIINYARSSGIKIGPGRGSCAGSLCIYVLGVTSIDPIKYGLLFERFLNPERVSPPDVDMDFDYNRRNEVFEYIVRKYGADHCSQIGTYTKFKARATIRNTSKALDLGGDWEDYVAKKTKSPDKKIEMGKNSLQLADLLSKQVDFDAKSLQEALKKSDDFKDSMARYPKLLECARVIEGTVAAAGVHPAGIIVCKYPVVDRIPLRVSKGVTCSQYDGPEVEHLGLLKFDMLALKTLTVVDRTVKMIKERHGKDIDVDKLEPNDKVVFRAIMNDTKGIFQFESFGMHRLLNSINIDTFDDMVVANALYRPGPLGEGMHDMYAEYKHHPDRIEYLHPKMGVVLKETYGILVFQEGIMKLSQELAGFTGGQADSLRKVVGKKKPELIKKENLDEKFYAGCIKNGISEDVAKKIFAQIYQFAGYGFNKSHACAYAFLAYQTGWLRHYYPIEYMCNLLSSEIQNSDKNKKLKEYFQTTERMGLNCWRNHINKSGLEFKIDTLDGKEIIRSPFTILDGVGEKAVVSIVNGQPYKNLEDFLLRVDTRLVNSRVFGALLKSGCMDDAWKVPRSVLLSQYEVMKEKIMKDKKLLLKQQKRKEMYGEENLFDDDFSKQSDRINL